MKKPRRKAPETAAPVVKQRAPVPLDHPELLAKLAVGRAEIDRLRETACHEVPVELCGEHVEQFKPRHRRVLAIAGNPIVTGGRAPELVDALQFLWIVSTKFSLAEGAAEAFADDVQFGEEELPEILAEIYEYIEDAFMDAFGGASDPGVAPTAGLTAWLHHAMLRAYGWSEERVDNTPFAALFQRLRLIDEDARCAAGAPHRIQFSRLDKIKREFVAAYRKANP
jgi:hypothetical protein